MRERIREREKDRKRKGRIDDPLAYVFSKERKPTKSSIVVGVTNEDVELRRLPIPTL